MQKELARLCSGIADEDNQGDLFGREKEINFNSPAQVKKILSKMGHEVESTGTGTLEKLDSDFARAMVKHRKTSKAKSKPHEP